MQSRRSTAVSDRRVPHTRNITTSALAILAAFGGAACADAPTSAPVPATTAATNRSEGRGLFQRYVALGTGMSMGWQSGGLTAGSQYESWPAQLARIAHRELNQPYLATPTCFPPMLAPFGSFTFAPSGPCANEPGTALPARNLAIRGATVTSALNAMVGNAVQFDSGYGFTAVMPLVLPAGATQVTALQGLEPKVVSVEYGTSEILRALVTPVPGVIRPTISPTAWVARYDEILDAVAKSSDVVVLALPSRAIPPGFVPAGNVVGALLSPQAQADFNIAPPPFPCEVVGRFVYAPQLLRLIIGEALAARTGGGGPVPLDCQRLFRSDLSFSLDTYDLVRPPVEAIRRHIVDEATARGFAYFDLETLYTSYTQPSFDLTTFMTSNDPFGPYLSLDGIYPTAAGNQLLAQAAARALNATYALGLPVSAPTSRLAR